jgi:hypothetical protein
LSEGELHFKLHSWALFESFDRSTSLSWDDCLVQEKSLLEATL